MHAFCFSVDRVDQRLAVVAPQRAFHRFGVGGIHLQRQIHHTLQLAHHMLQHRRFINIRQTHIHIQNVRAIVHLGNALLQDIIHIFVAQRLLKA